MNLKKWPSWLKGGLITAIVGTPVFILLPEEFSNLAFVPWYAAWFVAIAFAIFAPICILFRIDFISEAAGKSDLIAAGSIWFFSIFVTFFIVGSVGTIIIYYVKALRHPD